MGNTNNVYVNLALLYIHGNTFVIIVLAKNYYAIENTVYHMINAYTRSCN